MVNQGEHDTLQSKAKPDGIFFQPVTRQRDGETEHGYTPHDYTLDTARIRTQSLHPS
jgi:hypothetical protein